MVVNLNLLRLPFMLDFEQKNDGFFFYPWCTHLAFISDQQQGNVTGSLKDNETEFVVLNLYNISQKSTKYRKSHSQENITHIPVTNDNQYIFD